MDRARFPAQDAVLCAALGALALLVRLPGLGEVPGFTDEIQDVLQAVGIVRGEHYPLSHEYGSSYIGAWHSYLVALSLLMGGLDVAAARALTLLFGVLTVMTTYLLARELKLGRPEAAAAALVLLASGAHILLGSRVVWASCTVPFYTTLAALLVHRTIRLRTPRLALGAGFVVGLGISSHPAAVLALLPMAAWFVWKAWRDDGPANRIVPIALVGMLVAVSPLMLYNLQSGFGSLRDVAELGGAYQAAAGRPSYLTNLGGMAVLLGQLVTSSFGSPATALTDPMFYLAYALSFAGLIWFVTRGLWWPPLAIAAMALVVPFWIPRSSLVMDGRYVLPVLPLLLIGAAGAIGWAGRLALARSSAASSGARLLTAALITVVITVLLGVMTLLPLQRWRLYEAETLPYNAMLRELANDIASVRSAGEPVLIDRELQLEYQPQFPVSVGRGKVLEMLFTLDGVPHRFVRSTPAGVQAVLADLDIVSAVLVTLPGRDVGLTAFDRLPLGETPLINDQEVAVYRVTRTPAGSNDDGIDILAFDDKNRSSSATLATAPRHAARRGSAASTASPRATNQLCDLWAGSGDVIPPPRGCATPRAGARYRHDAGSLPVFYVHPYGRELGNRYTGLRAGVTTPRLDRGWWLVDRVGQERGRAGGRGVSDVSLHGHRRVSPSDGRPPCPAWELPDRRQWLSGGCQTGQTFRPSDRLRGAISC